MCEQLTGRSPFVSLVGINCDCTSRSDFRAVSPSSHAIDRSTVCGESTVVVSRPAGNKGCGEARSEPRGCKRKSIISRDRSPRSIKFVKFRRRNNARFVGPAPSSVGSPHTAHKAPSSSSSSWAIQGAKRRPVDGIIIVI